MTDDTSTARYYDLLVERDVNIPLRDGEHVVADVFRPDGHGEFGTIMTLGPYSKDIHFKDWSPDFDYATLPERGPYMHWETANPEWWTPQGYVVIRVDTRGTGKSPGRVRRLSDDEARDFYDCIEWAATQPWSNGRVAVMGISYFAMNSWRVAAQQPPHLACIVPWEGAVDTYRDAGRHGGIYSNNFNQRWSRNVRRHHGQTGGGENEAPPAPSELYDERAYNIPDLSRIEVPVLSAGNWGGVGLHLRGNVEGFLGVASKHKMLEIHSGNHILPFYSLEGRLFQKRFLDQWLYDIDTGIDREPPVKLAIRRGGDDFEWRYENEWPIARTQWTSYYLDANDATLAAAPAQRGATLEYVASDEGDRVAFSTAFERETEFTGPAKLKLWISSTSDDADLFVTLRKLDAGGNEVRFPAQNGPSIPAAAGWLRASHRKLDAARSTPYRPYHTHDALEKLEPGEIVPVEVEIWPTSVVFAPGEKLVLEVGSSDDPGLTPFLHNHPVDRIREGIVTVHTGGAHDAHLLLPLIPRNGV
jgi:predicted acyl esterase